MPPIGARAVRRAHASQALPLYRAHVWGGLTFELMDMVVGGLAGLAVGLIWIGIRVGRR